MKKILHILNTDSFSGAENVAISIITNFESEYESAYLSLKGSIGDRLYCENIKYFSVNKLNIRNINRVIDEYKPDIIHAHDFTASILCVLGRRAIPIISHLHNNPPWIKSVNIRSFAYKITMKKYKNIISVSDAIPKEYIFSKPFMSKWQVIGNPISINSVRKKGFQNLENSKRYDIVYLGRLAEQKNPIRFLNILLLMVNEGLQPRVAIIGDGELKDECQTFIKSNGLDSIEMLGFLDNPFPILKNAKVLCMTSSWEGFGLVAVEAMSLGIPVVATPVGGLPGIVNDECGLLTEDDKAYISELTKLIYDKNYQEKKSKAAINRVFTLRKKSKYFLEINQLYVNILNKKDNVKK